MKKFRIRNVVVAIVLITVMLVSGCGGTKTNSENGTKIEPIKIGVTNPVTGSLADLGRDIESGIVAAATRINETGGINGRPIELVKADTPDPTAAAGEADRLINREKVKMIIGTYGSTIAAAVSEVAARNNIPYLEVVSTGSVITQRGYNNIFRFSPDSTSFAKVAGKAVTDLVPTALGKSKTDLKIAMAYEDGLYGSSLAEAFKQVLEKEGLKNNLLVAEPYPATTKDLSTLVLKFKQLQPDILVMLSYQNDATLFVRQSKELGFNVPVFLGGGGGYGQPGFIQALGKMADGILDIEYPSLPPLINKEALAGIDEYISYYKKVYNKEPGGVYAHVGYAGANVMFEALKKAGSTEPEAISKALYSLDIPWWNTTAGWGAKFVDEGKDKGKNTRAEPYLTQWKDGKLYVVYPEKAQAMKPILPKPQW